MPKTVDHEQRRTQLVDALVRVAARDGMPAVTMRSVAAEADMSLRLVQYYFQSKAELMRAALERLTERSNRRWAARLASLPRPVPARRFVEEFLAEALPTDEPSRAFHIVGSAYAVQAMTDPELAEHPLVTGLHQLECQLADTLRRARAEGELPMDRDPEGEAACLVALNHGIGTTVLVGQRTVASAMELYRYHLDRLFASE